MDADARLSRVEGDVSLLTDDVCKLKRAVRLLVHEVRDLGGSLDPSLVLLLIGQEAEEEHGDERDDERPASVVVLDPIPHDRKATRGALPTRDVQEDAEERRRRLGRERVAAKRRGVSVDAFRAESSTPAERYTPADVTLPVTHVTPDVTLPVTHVTLGSVTSSVTERYMPAPGRAPERGSTSSCETSSLISSDPSLLLVSSSPSSCSSDHDLDPGLHSRAREPSAAQAAPALDAAPTLLDAAPTLHRRTTAAPPEARPLPIPPPNGPQKGSGKRRDPGTWGLVDRCAGIYRELFPRSKCLFAPSGGQVYARTRVYDACARALSHAHERMPARPIGERFDVAAEAFRLHMTRPSDSSSVPAPMRWRTFADHVFPCVEDALTRKRRADAETETARATSSATDAARAHAEKLRTGEVRLPEFMRRTSSPELAAPPAAPS